MAKRVIGESYTFTPASRLIVVNKAIRRESLVLILNVTTNTVIYNFSDSSLTASGYTINTLLNAETTSITLAYNTTAMNANDKLSIIVDEVDITIYPSETLMDPVQKLRTSQPQALIDTDFEYSVQTTKWETVALVNNRPTAFFDQANPITNINTALTFFGGSGNYQITNIAGAGTRLVTVTINNTTGITTSTPVYIQDTLFPDANGWVIPQAVTTNTSFTYFADSTIPSQTIYDFTKTYVFIGQFYSTAGIPISSTAGVAFTYVGTAVTVTTLNNHGLAAGDAIFVVGTSGATNNPNGNWKIRQTPTSNTFIFDVVNAPTTGSIAVTAAGSGLTVNFTAISGEVITATVNAAGTNYRIGDIVTISGGGSNARVTITGVGASGAATQIQVQAPGTGYSTASAVATTMFASGNTLFARSYGNAIHRPFDGGVLFTAGIPYNGQQLIRQTRRYFRYQSGKGVQFSTGSNMMPPFFLDNLTSSGTTVTVNTRMPHYMGVGANIAVSGATESAYNGRFTVASTPTLNQFTYTALSTPTASPANGWPINVQPAAWFGASIRVGMFDSQNGFFWEHDGQTLYAVLRSSTGQLHGAIRQLCNGNTQVLGTATRWSDQLIPGDQIVIRGGVYSVQSIQSATEMTIYPEYRGQSALFPSQLMVSKVIDTRIPQSSFNIDKLDGNGMSMYNLDITKMQMWYIDYSWYGAGAIRFGVKDHRGEVRYAHRIANANRNTEAYMRSGNLPARYECNTNWPYTRTTATISNTETGTINVVSTIGFPNAGTLMVEASGNTGAPIEYITYTGKSSTTFTGLTRAVVNLSGPGGLTSIGGATAAQTFTFSATAPIQVALYSPQAGVTIGHWGSSVIMDGRYDDDKSFVFNYGQNAAVTYANAAQRYPVFSIRLAPSVDSGIVGLLGAREVINRMQLTPRSIGIISTTASVRVEILLNARITGTATNWVNVGGSSLAQYNVHTAANGVAGGEPIFTFFNMLNTSNSQDLNLVRDLGNSILGGGTNSVMNLDDRQKFPDGPDQITLVVTPLAANASSALRLNWTEAQA